MLQSSYECWLIVFDSRTFLGNIPYGSSWWRGKIFLLLFLRKTEEEKQNKFIYQQINNRNKYRAQVSWQHILLSPFKHFFLYFMYVWLSSHFTQYIPAWKRAKVTRYIHIGSVTSGSQFYHPLISCSLLWSQNAKCKTHQKSVLTANLK